MKILLMSVWKQYVFQFTFTPHFADCSHWESYSGGEPVDMQTESQPVNIHFLTPDSISKVHAIERPPRFILASQETLLVSNPIKSEVAVDYV